MDKEEPAPPSKGKLEWCKGFLHKRKGERKSVLSPCQEPKEPPVILLGGLPQGSGLSPSAYYKLLGNKGIDIPPVKLLQFDFRDLAKETKEADSNEEMIRLLK
jgi:hypothetical protein